MVEKAAISLGGLLDMTMKVQSPKSHTYRVTKAAVAVSVHHRRLPFTRVAADPDRVRHPAAAHPEANGIPASVWRYGKWGKAYIRAARKRGAFDARRTAGKCGAGRGILPFHDSEGQLSWWALGRRVRLGCSHD